MTTKEKQEQFKAKERAKALAAVRPETNLERNRRLKPGWDYRLGGRAAREKAKAAQ